MTTYFADESGLAYFTSSDMAKPVQGTAMDHASTQRNRYSRSSNGMARIRVSISSWRSISTMPSKDTVQGRSFRERASRAMRLWEPNS